MLALSAAFFDLFTMRIPNKLVLAMVACFIPAALLAGLPLDDLALRVGFALGVLLLGFVLFYFGVMGGGDAKFAAAIALWLGTTVDVVTFLILMAFYGGGLTLVILGFRKVPYLPAPLRYEWLLRLHDKKTGVPYGITIAIAAVIVFQKSDWVMPFLLL